MTDKQTMNLMVDVGRILLSHIVKAQEDDDLLIFYGDVARKLPYDFNPRNLDNPLGMLSDMCLDLGLPLISVIVVNRDSYMPGVGFYRYFFPGSKEPQEIEIFTEQYNLVKECSDWRPLAQALGL